MILSDGYFEFWINPYLYAYLKKHCQHLFYKGNKMKFNIRVYYKFKGFYDNYQISYFDWSGEAKNEKSAIKKAEKIIRDRKGIVLYSDNLDT